MSLGRSQSQSSIRLSHEFVLRENTDLSSSLLLRLLLFSLLFFSSPVSPHAPLSVPSCLPSSLMDCNNKRNDNNGDGGLGDDVKKHNITITNTHRAANGQRLTSALIMCVCLRVLVCVCVSERGRLLACCIYGHFLPV